MIAELRQPTLWLATKSTSNTKADKRATLEGRPILNALLHLSPANRSGYDTCGGRTKGCTSACLDMSGHGRIGADFDANGVMLKSNSVQDARIRRTVKHFEAQAEFMADLVHDIAAVEAKALAQGAVPAFRPNATSDLDYTVIPCVRNGQTFANIFDAFPNVHFYDYTKVRERMMRYLRGELPRNYHLTFSRAETKANQITAMHVLQMGGNVAAVFSTVKGQRLPDVWNGHLVIDGDVHDFRFLDPRATSGKSGYIIGLRSKARAQQDTSGFVIQLS